jgi:hypothetical protein
VQSASGRQFCHRHQQVARKRFSGSTAARYLHAALRNETGAGMIKDNLIYHVYLPQVSRASCFIYTHPDHHRSQPTITTHNKQTTRQTRCDGGIRRCDHACNAARTIMIAIRSPPSAGTSAHVRSARGREPRAVPCAAARGAPSKTNRTQAPCTVSLNRPRGRAGQTKHAGGRLRGVYGGCSNGITATT